MFKGADSIVRSNGVKKPETVSRMTRIASGIIRK